MSNPSLAPQPEHNTRYAACQSAPVGSQSLTKERSERASVDWRLVRRYGAHVLAQGYTACPNLILQHYAALGLSEAELVFVLQLWTYWWDTTLPHPSLSTIAQRMGKSVRQVQLYAEHLRRLGLLEVIYRHDRQGRQLSNSFDLTPLLRALAAFNDTVPGQATARDVCPAPDFAVHQGGAHLNAAGVQSRATPALQCISPKEDTVQPDIDLDSIPPTPVIARAPRTRPNPGVRAADNHPLSKMLQEYFPRISAALGDAAPTSSLGRAARLLDQSGLSPTEAAGQVEAAVARVAREARHIRRCAADGRRNAMPYFLAVLEQRTSAAGPAVRASRQRRAAERPYRAAMVPCAISCDVEPTWRAVLQELQGVIPPRTFNERLASTLARRPHEGVLEVLAASQFDARWLDRMLRKRVEEALALLGHRNLEVTFIAGDATQPEGQP